MTIQNLKLQLEKAEFSGIYDEGLNYLCEEHNCTDFYSSEEVELIRHTLNDGSFFYLVADIVELIEHDRWRTV